VAYDASLQSGCSGTPKVCSPVADVALGSFTNPPDAPVVWDGRVYVSFDRNDRVVVLSLPGDVR